MRVAPSSAVLYAGELAMVTLKSGASVRVLIARDQVRDHAFTLAQTEDDGDLSFQDIDFDDIDWLEIDGPRHPKDRSGSAS